MQLAYDRKNNLKKLSQKVQSIHGKLMLQKHLEEEEGSYMKSIKISTSFIP